MSIYKEMESLMSPQNNFRNYRELILSFEADICEQLSSLPKRSATGIETSQSPSQRKVNNTAVIPILSLFMKDLLFTSDGNPKRFDDTGLLNWGKLMGMYQSVKRVLIYQRYSYSIPIANEDIRDFCANLRSLKEDTLYKYSCLAEARAGDAGTVRMINKWKTDN